MAKTTKIKTEKKPKAAKVEKVPVDLGSQKVYSKDGKEVSTIALPESCFGLSWNADLVHQVITSLQTSARHPYAHARMRGEVRGGGKKPWQQKGTGQARHGSTRSPIWVGGGVAHGPRNDKNFDRKVNKKAKDKAIATILSKKVKDGEMIFVDSFGLEAPKTVAIKNILAKLATAEAGFGKLATKKYNAALIITPTVDKNMFLSTRNFKNLETQDVGSVNPINIAKYKYIILTSPKESVNLFAARLTNK
jgi:large subunit ribosomal protein L4